jgi:3'-phosphoadenosine 5'-phosphosulfate (PAPS) 3'-phosphatase
LTSISDLQLEKRRRLPEEACRAAAAVHLKYRQPAIPFETKNGNKRDLVTIADTEAQAAATAVIEAAFPGETIIAEEVTQGPVHHLRLDVPQREVDGGDGVEEEAPASPDVRRARGTWRARPSRSAEGRGRGQCCARLTRSRPASSEAVGDTRAFEAVRKPVPPTPSSVWTSTSWISGPAAAPSSVRD